MGARLLHGIIMKYEIRKTERAKKTPGKSLKVSGKKPPLGKGGRFKALEKGLEKKGAKNPGALAAYIGRKKYGAKKMGQLSGKGRKEK